MASFLHRFITGVAAAVCIAGVAGADPEDPDREGGILGTGILGNVTALGSIYVNGQHVNFDADFPVTGGFGPMMARDLLPGDTVAVVAVPEGDAWRATSIRRMVPLMGPVAQISGNEIHVLGNLVVAERDLGDLSVGDWVAVSGLWKGKTVMASRIELIDPQAHTMISGTTMGPDAKGKVMIGNTEVMGMEDDMPQDIAPGDVIEVTGMPMAKAVMAKKLTKGVFDAPVGVVAAQGYLAARADMVSLLGSGMMAHANAAQPVDETSETMVCGYDGHLMDDPADPMPQSVRDLMDRLGCFAP